MAIKRGPMTDAERAEIDRLAQTLKNPKPGEVARRLNRHVATVCWYMMNKGYLRRRLIYSNTPPYKRRGRTVYRYTEPEDRRIIALRIEGMDARQIAEIVSSEFGRPRTGHSIDVRLKILAAYENSPEEIAA